MKPDDPEAIAARLLAAITRELMQAAARCGTGNPLGEALVMAAAVARAGADGLRPEQGRRKAA